MFTFVYLLNSNVLNFTSNFFRVTRQLSIKIHIVIKNVYIYIYVCNRWRETIPEHIPVKEILTFSVFRILLY